MHTIQRSVMVALKSDRMIGVLTEKKRWARLGWGMTGANVLEFVCRSMVSGHWSLVTEEVMGDAEWSKRNQASSSSWFSDEQGATRWSHCHHSAHFDPLNPRLPPCSHLPCTVHIART